MDPHYSVLVGDANEGLCHKKKGLSKKLLIIYIVVPVVVAMILVLAFIVVFYPRYDLSLRPSFVPSFIPSFVPSFPLLRSSAPPLLPSSPPPLLPSSLLFCFSSYGRLKLLFQVQKGEKAAMRAIPLESPPSTPPMTRV